MKAVLYEAFGATPRIQTVDDPSPSPDGVVVKVEAVGRDVKRWNTVDRVTVPFAWGCGDCLQCHSGNQQVCDHQFQPGFSAWGSFAEYVALDYADTNLLALPEQIDFATAASLGCRFVTSFRAVVDQGRVSPGEFVAVHGCGGAHVSLDALGYPQTCLNSIDCLRKRGRHVQVGLMPADHARPAIPMDRVISHELEIVAATACRPIATVL